MHGPAFLLEPLPRSRILFHTFSFNGRHHPPLFVYSRTGASCKAALHFFVSVTTSYKRLKVKYGVTSLERTEAINTQIEHFISHISNHKVDLDSVHVCGANLEWRCIMLDSQCRETDGACLDLTIYEYPENRITGEIQAAICDILPLHPSFFCVHTLDALHAVLSDLEECIILCLAGFSVEELIHALEKLTEGQGGRATRLPNISTLLIDDTNFSDTPLARKRRLDLPSFAWLAGLVNCIHERSSIGLTMGWINCKDPAMAARNKFANMLNHCCQWRVFAPREFNSQTEDHHEAILRNITDVETSKGHFKLHTDRTYS